jgi:hypothetical protein
LLEKISEVAIENNQATYSSDVCSAGTKVRVHYA